MSTTRERKVAEAELDSFVKALPEYGSEEAIRSRFYIGESGLRHEVMVENPSSHFQSPLGRYLRTASKLDPTKLMYRKVSDDPVDTLGMDSVLLDCAVEDHAAMLAENDLVAMQAYNPSPPPSTDKVAVFGHVERGEPVTLL